MNHRVYLIADAEADLYDLYHYVSLTDSIDKAETLIRQIEEACLKLSCFPDRGHIPPELERIGVMEYRETHFKPYRIIYQVIQDDVYIHCILDGRRELQELLEKRIIR